MSTDQGSQQQSDLQSWRSVDEVTETDGASLGAPFGAPMLAHAVTARGIGGFTYECRAAPQRAINTLEAIEQHIRYFPDKGTQVPGTEIYLIRLTVPGCPPLRVAYHIDSETQCTCLDMEMAEAPAPGPLEDFV